MNLEKDSRKVGNEIKREEDRDGAGRQKKKKMVATSKHRGREILGNPEFSADSCSVVGILHLAAGLASRRCVGASAHTA